MKFNENLSIVNNMIDEITGHLNTLPYDNIIFGGDLNTNLKVGFIVSDAIHGLARDFDLIDCVSIATPPIDYSFHAVTTGHRSLIDWLLVSKSLGPAVSALNILELGINLSDHLPVVLDIKLILTNDVNIGSNHSKPKPDVKLSHLNWNKADLDCYYECSKQLLQSSFDCSQILIVL